MSIATVVRGTATQPVQAVIGRVRHKVGGQARLRVIVVLACVLGLDSADAGAIGAAGTEIRHGLHVSTTDIGLLLAVSSAVAAVATVPAGALVDRFNRVRVLVAAVLLWTLATLGAALAPDYTALLLAQCLLGLTTAVAGPATASLVGDYFPETERGRVWSWVISGELIGAGVGLVVCGGAAALSWRAGFAALTLPAAAVVLLLARLPEPTRGGASRLEVGTADLGDVGIEDAAEPAPASAPSRIPLRSAVRYVLSARTNVTLIVVSALGYFFFAGVRGFGMSFVRKQYDLGQFEATMLIPIVGLGAIAGAVIAGRLSDRRRSPSPRARSHRVLVAGLAMGAATVILAPAVMTSSLGIGLVLLIVGAALVAGQNPPLDAARLDIVPAQLWGRAEGIRTLLKSGASALAPLVFGAIAGHTFGGGLPGMRAAFLMTLVPMAGGAVLLFTYARRHYLEDVARAAQFTRAAARH